jgi:hypothetical protein
VAALLGVLLSMMALLTSVTGSSGTAGIASGASIQGFPSDPAAIDAFSEMVGEKPGTVMWYQDWSGGFVQEHFDAVASRGMVPMLTWEPKNYPLAGSNPEQPSYALRTIIRGDHDDYIRRFAQDAKEWTEKRNEPLYLRFAHEMNGDWYPWGVGVNGNRPGEYVAAWRHVHDIFEQEEATKVEWVWTPNVREGTPEAATYRSLFPGDAYVDWVGLDGYNWGSGRARPDGQVSGGQVSEERTANWQSFGEVFARSYGELVELTDKPMVIGETGSAESGGDKAAWIRDAYLDEAPSRFPRIKAVIWFHKDQTGDKENTNWRVDTSQASLDAYREASSRGGIDGP